MKILLTGPAIGVATGAAVFICFHLVRRPFFRHQIDSLIAIILAISAAIRRERKTR